MNAAKVAFQHFKDSKSLSYWNSCLHIKNKLASISSIHYIGSHDGIYVMKTSFLLNLTSSVNYDYSPAICLHAVCIKNWNCYDNLIGSN
jgi:hypothetical protein